MVKFNAFRNVKESYTTVPKEMWRLRCLHKITFSSIGIYSLLTDRLSSSVKKGIIDKNLAFYDPKSAQWFVDYSETEAARNLGVTKGTASNSYHKLQKLNYINFEVRPKNYITRIYFPRLAPYLPQPKGIANKSSNTVVAFKGWGKRTHKYIGLSIKSLKLTVDLVQNKLNLDTKAAENIVRYIMAGRNQAAYDWHISTTNKHFMFEKSGYFNSGSFINDLNGIFTIVYQNYKNTHILDIKKIKKYITKSIKNHFENWLTDNGIKKRRRKLKKPAKKSMDSEERDLMSNKSPELHPTSAARQKRDQQRLAKSEAQSKARRERLNKSNNNSSASAKADHPSSNNDSLADGSSLSNFYNDLNNSSSASQSANANKSNSNKDTHSTNKKPSDSENKVTSDELFSIDQLKSMVKNPESYDHAMDSLHNQANSILPFGHEADVIDAKKNQLKKAFKKHFKAIHATASVE